MFLITKNKGQHFVLLNFCIAKPEQIPIKQLYHCNKLFVVFVIGNLDR